MNLDAEYCITKALGTCPLPAALPSGKASGQHLPPSQEPAQQLGGARQCAVGGGVESWAGPGAVSSCRDTAPAVQTLPWICWSTAVTASSSLFTHKQKKGAGPELLLHYSPPGCALATPPLGALALLPQVLLWPQEKAAFWQCKSSILNDTRLTFQPPTPSYTLLKVSVCLQGFSLGSCFPSIPRLFPWSPGQRELWVWAWNQGTARMWCRVGDLEKSTAFSIHMQPQNKPWWWRVPRGITDQLTAPQHPGGLTQCWPLAIPTLRKTIGCNTDLIKFSDLLLKIYFYYLKCV